MKNKTGTKKKHATWTKVSDLQKMGLDELRAEYERVFGKPTKSRNRKQLFARISRKLQEAGNGQGQSVLTARFQPKGKQPKKKAGKGEQKKHRAKPVGSRDPRLPKPGTTITKEYKGKTINVRVLEKGVQRQLFFLFSDNYYSRFVVFPRG